MKKFSLMLVLLTSLALISCDDDDDDDSTNSQNIVELAQAEPELSSLVAALTEAGLVSTLEGDGPFTVFAPNNDAFAELLKDNNWNTVADIPDQLLEDVLKYHVLSGKVMSGGLSAGYVPTLSDGPGETTTSLMVTLDGGAKFNDAGPVELDQDASNGVVHIIDKVIMPMNMVDIATGNPNLSMLVEALQVQGLGLDFLGALANDTEYTVFAPTNAAFQKVLDANNVSMVSELGADLLTKVLSYHIVSGNVTAGMLSEGEVPTLLNGQNLTIDLSSGVTLETTTSQMIPVEDTNIQATNGVYHTIETVLMPN